MPRRRLQRKQQSGGKPEAAKMQQQFKTMQKVSGWPGWQTRTEEAAIKWQACGSQDATAVQDNAKSLGLDWLADAN